MSTTTAARPLSRLARHGAALVVVLAFGALALVGLAGPAQAAGTPPGASWIRAGHFVPGFGAARIDLTPKTGATTSIIMSPSASYGDVTSYQKVQPGEYVVAIRDVGSTESSAPMLSRSLTVTSGGATTIAVVGTSNAPRLAVLTDDLALPAAGTAKVRLLSASSLAPAVTVKAESGPTIANMAVLGQTTGYTTVPKGAWTLQLTSGTGMSATQKITLASGSVYTAVALDRGTTGVQIKLITDAASAVAQTPAGVAQAAPIGAAATGFGGMADTSATTGATTGIAPLGVAVPAALAALAAMGAVAGARRRRVSVTQQHLSR